MKGHTIKNRFALITLIVFVTALATIGASFFILPKSTFSKYEKRKLTTLPVFSVQSFFNGTYLANIDLYFADNFPSRDNFVSTSFYIKEKRGIQSKKIGFYKTVALDAQLPESVDTTFGKADSIPLDSANRGKAETTGGVVIYDGRAMEVFGGNYAMAKAYSSMINKYQEIFQDIATLYVVVVPSSIAFYPPTEYRKVANSEKINIDQIYGLLSPGVKAVNASDEILNHKSEYIYFGTDHHWTGLGAYYAYVAFCKAAAINPISLDAMTYKVKKKYLGSLYYLTRDSRLKENTDSVEYWMVPGNHKTLRYGSITSKGTPATLYAEYASGGNAYGVFLGGDNPLMKIDNEIKNGRKCVIVKNSYGNPFATYFTANYETVFIIDYRYYTGSLVDLIKENNINDIIFLNGVFSANTSWHIKMMGKVMKGYTKPPLNAQKDSIIKYTDTLKSNRKNSLK